MSTLVSQTRRGAHSGRSSFLWAVAMSSHYTDCFFSSGGWPTLTFLSEVLGLFTLLSSLLSDRPPLCRRAFSLRAAFSGRQGGRGREALWCFFPSFSVSGCVSGNRLLLLRDSSPEQTSRSPSLHWKTRHVVFMNTESSFLSL